MRDANMNQKMGTTWLLLFDEPFDAEAAKDIDRVASARNSFVHYKWPEGHLDDGPAKVGDLTAAISSAERAVSFLDGLLPSLPPDAG